MKPKWTEQQKRDALELARSTSIPKVAELTGIPEGTLKRWKKEEGKRSDPVKSDPIRSDPLKRSDPAKKAGPSDAELTEKQKAFVQEYLIDLNAKAAAVRAGYSEKTAEQIGYQQLQKPAVRAAIQKAMELRARRTEITADRVLQELAKIGFAQLGDFVEFGPEEVVIRRKKGKVITATVNTVRVKPSSEVDGSVLSEVSQTVNGIKVKQHDKIKALELLGKHLGLFIERHEHTGKDGGPIEFRNARELLLGRINSIIERRRERANTGQLN